MKKGNILLVNYKLDPIGYLIKWTTHSHYNHVAWALNEYVFIESTGKGIKTTLLDKYLNSFLYDIKLIELKDLTKSQINKITKLLVAQRGKVPYWKFFISYFLIACHRKGLVQNCSNFIWNAMNIVGFKCCKGNKKYVVPEDFNKLKYIEVPIPKGTNLCFYTKIFKKNSR